CLKQRDKVSDDARLLSARNCQSPVLKAAMQRKSKGLLVFSQSRLQGWASFEAQSQFRWNRNHAYQNG
ncbi:MAG: hypothetical protein M9919_12610, partial [Burkholderiaceae bacterium]|nr:hypothetical protein [Burkholderiaceae bacterium]